MTLSLTLYGVTVAGLLLLTILLHLLHRLGQPGQRLATLASQAPLLDVLVFCYTTLPMLVGLVLGYREEGRLTDALWLGFVGVLGQITTMWLWIIAHEIRHRKTSKGVRITPTLNRLVGPVRNHVAVWWTAWAVPLFTLVRLVEILVYPMLIWLVKFPRYKQSDWVNVSRQKYQGLVGYDRIWCLYCDWMTGIWSLGSEMLRNVESFWCPIRFSSPEKCENCKVDFPDIEGGWVNADASMEEVVAVLKEKYEGNDTNAWFGHTTRLTVEGKTPESSADDK